MKLLFLLISVPACLSFRPKGVRPEMGTFYNPASDFKCLDGSNTIPFIQINDDYCDCEDGSDEPGTSACPRGRFYCENKGHRALILPSSRVGDSICDCCDGSDEWERVAAGGEGCPNTCEEEGREAREAREQAERVRQAGVSVRQGMVQEGGRLRGEKEGELTSLEGRKGELERVKEEKEKVKEEAEAPEKEALEFYRQLEEEEKRKREELEKAEEAAKAGDYFMELDTDGDGIVTVTELQARPGLDTDKNGEVSEEEAKFFLADSDQFTLETFVSSGYALLKPYLDLEAVPEEQPSMEEEEEEEDPSFGDDEDFVVPTEEVHVVDHPMATPAPDEVDIPDHPMNTPEPPAYDDDYDETDEDEDYDVNDHDDDDMDDIRDEIDSELPKIEEPKDESKYDSATQELINKAEEARKAFKDAEKELRDVEGKIKNLKDSLEKDYGVENEFMVLQGQCFDYTDNEYKYSMCPFDHCTQAGKHGGGSTRLGNWGEWGGPEGEGRYSVMKFVGGQQCWNGPARSTTVYLHCATENTLTSVSEPNRCEYEMHFTTPAVCGKQTPNSGHDEL